MPETLPFDLEKDATEINDLAAWHGGKGGADGLAIVCTRSSRTEPRGPRRDSRGLCGLAQVVHLPSGIAFLSYRDCGRVRPSETHFKAVPSDTLHNDPEADHA